jgi:hypothetical protein
MWYNWFFLVLKPFTEVLSRICDAEPAVIRCGAGALFQNQQLMASG